MQGLSPHMESRVPHHIPGVSSSLISQPLLDSQVPYGRLQHPLTIYPIDQMRSSHVENDYIDSPAVVSQQPPSSQKSAGGSRRAITWLGQSQQQQDSSGAFLGANHNHHHNHQQHGRCEPPPPHHPGRQDATTHPWISFSGRPSSISSSSSTSSDQRLLDHAAPTPTLDPHLAPHPHHPHHHPHPHHPHQGSLGGSAAPARTLGCFAAAPPSSSADPKVLTTASSSSSICSSSSKSLDLKASNATAGGVGGGGGVGGVGVCGGQPQVSALIPSSPAEKKHLVLCERCGKCRCTECTLPRALPSCWVCNQECLCSAQSLVDSATCMCLVRGVFYHCAEDEDDEGSCADRPCSCSQTNCCARWSFMAALSVVLPCLLCYLPATGLAKLGQRCYDNASRPGCRCKQGTVGAAQGTVGAGCKSGGGGGGGGVEGKAQGTTEKQQQQQQGS